MKAYHRNNRVIISGYYGAQEECCYELNIAESTWYRVSNGVNRSFVGRCFANGKSFKALWVFSNGHLTIKEDDTVLVSISINEIID